MKHDVIHEIENLLKDHHLRRSTDLKSLLKLKLRFVANDKEKLNFLLENMDHFDRLERKILLEAIFDVLTEKLEDEIREINAEIDRFNMYDFIFFSVGFWKKWVGIVLWFLVVVILALIIFGR